jgi:hypothetical protein
MPGNLSWMVEAYELRPRDHGRIVREMFRERGDYHMNKRVPRHFNRNRWTSPSGPYGYRARSQQTIRRKKKKGVDAYRPNVMTGEMYGLVQSNGKVTATQNRWTWRSRGSAKRPLPDWQRRELEALAEDERREDINNYFRTYSREAMKPENRRLRRRKVSAS